MNCLALDIGGASLKAADGFGFAAWRDFPLWKTPDALPRALRDLLSNCPAHDRLAVTMTGELADCFATKREGVARILAAVAEATGRGSVLVYLTSGQFVDPPRAARQPLAAAASNWHALASFACRMVRRDCGLLVDVGSTTADIVPLSPAGPLAQGTIDPERLACGELVYTGVRRSPICAVLRDLPWRGQPCPVAHEVFATTGDAYVTLGDIAEDATCTTTADGRPLTRRWARDRLARSICADRDLFDSADARAAAQRVRQAQVALLANAAQAVAARLPAVLATVVASGQGEFLASEVCQSLGLVDRLVSLAEEFGPAVSRVATAHALALLARAEVEA